MNGRRRTTWLGWTLAAATAVVPVGAGAQPREVATYVVTSIGASAAGNVVTNETLSIERAPSGSRLRLASTDGSVLSVPATFTPQGEIASDSQDGAVTCYNMAVNALARSRRPDGPEASVFVRFGSSVVQIPLTVTATQTRANVRTTALNGTSTGVYAASSSAADAPVAAGVVIEATVEEQAGELHGALFDERHYVGTPAQLVGRSTCVLRRAATPKITPA